MSDEFDALPVSYASTPLRVLALSEVDADTLGHSAVQETLTGNLDALERVIPASCTSLESAHEHFDNAVFMSVCASFPIAENFDNSFRSRGERMPLLWKVCLALMGTPDLGR